MYVVEGELLIRRDPAVFLGQFGVRSAIREEHTGYTYEDVVWTVASSEGLANVFAKRLRNRGAIPEDAAIEHITLLEQAEKYSQPYSHSVDVAKYRKPDLKSVLDNEVPEGAGLIAGEARF